MTPPWSTALDMGTLSPTKKGHPVKSDPFKVLTTGRGHGTVAGATLQLGVILPPASVKMQSSTVLVRITSQVARRPRRVSQWPVSVGAPQKSEMAGRLRCIPLDPLDAGVSQNRSSGHEGEGPPARKAKGYGQRQWVGQHRVSRIGVPKASNDGVLK